MLALCGRAYRVIVAAIDGTACLNSWRQMLRQGGTHTRLARPRTEGLEQRTLLAAISWDGGGDGLSWGDAKNWSGDVLPGAADDVTIAAGAGQAINFTSAAGNATIHSLISGSGLGVLGGSLTVTGTSQISNTLTVDGGTVVLDGDSSVVSLHLYSSRLAGTGSLILTGSSTWLGGTMAGSGRTVVASGGTLSIGDGNGAYIVHLERELQNQGSLTLNSSGRNDWHTSYLYMANGTINNDGNLGIASAAYYGWPRYYPASNPLCVVSSAIGTTNVFNNNAGATLSKTGNGWVQFLADATAGAVTFSNAGTVSNDDAGVLESDGGGVWTGTWVGTLTMNAGTTVFNGVSAANGILSIGDGTADFEGISSVGGVNQYWGTLSGSGTLTLAGTSNWLGGTMAGNGRTVVASAGTLNIGDGVSPYSVHLERELLNQGSLTIHNSGANDWHTSYLYMANGTINNDGAVTLVSAGYRYWPGGFRPDQNALDVVSSTVGTTNVFNNNAGGTVSKTGDGWVQFWSDATLGGVTFNNAGTVSNDDAGQLELDGGGTWTGTFVGAVTMNAGTTVFEGVSAPNGTISLGGGTADFEDASVVGGVNQSGGLLDGSGVLTLCGTSTWLGGTMTGSGKTVVGSGAALSIGRANSGCSVILGRQLDNQGTMTINNSGAGDWEATRLYMANGTINNDGSVILSAWGYRYWPGHFRPDENPLYVISSGAGLANAFNNNAGGTVTYNGDGWLQFLSDPTLGAVAFNNAGTVSNSDGGCLELDGGGTWTGTWAGAVTIHDGMTTFSGVSAPNGALTISGGTVGFEGDSSIGGMDLEAGSLSGSGTLTLTGTSSTWIGGTMAGSGKTVVASGGTLSIGRANSGCSVILGRELQNQGTLTLNNSGVNDWETTRLYMANGTINNDGTVTLNSAGYRYWGSWGGYYFRPDQNPLYVASSAAGTVNAFNNRVGGTVIRTGDGWVQFPADAALGGVSFNNAGAVEVQGPDRLELDAGGTWTGACSGAVVLGGGTFAFASVLAPTATITIGTGVTVSFSGDCTIGTLNLSGVSTDFEGPCTIGAMNVNGGGVRFDGAATIGTLSICSGATADLEVDSTVAVLNLSSGALVGSGTVTLTGPSTWTGGTMSGSGKTVVASGGTLSIGDGSNSYSVYLQREVDNGGSMVLNGNPNGHWGDGYWFGYACYLYLDNGTINNSGTFAAVNDTYGRVPSGSPVCVMSSQVGTSNAFNNQAGGTLTKTGSGLMLFPSDGAVTFNNDGMVNGSSGSLELDSGGLWTGQCSGVVSFSAGTTMFKGISGASGTISIGGATADFEGNSTIGGVNLSSGNLVGSGTVTLTGPSTWTGGTMSGSGKTVVASGGTLTIGDGNTSYSVYLQRELDSTGSVVLNGNPNGHWGDGYWFGYPCYLYLDNGTINNSGTFAAVNDTYGRVPSGSPVCVMSSQAGTSNAFNNQAGGTFSKTGSGLTLFYSDGGVPFNNAGTVNVAGAATVLQLDSGGSWSGTFAGDGTLLVGRDLTVDPSGVLAQTGTGTLVLGGGLNIGAAASLSQTAAGHIQLSGSLLGSTTNSAAFTPDGTILFNGSGTSGIPQMLEVMGADLGNAPAGFDHNFSYATLALGNGTYVKLVDQNRNSVGTNPEALYVDNLVVPAGCTLDLSGLNLYAQATQITGSIIGGNVVLQASGSITAAAPTQQWTFASTPGHQLLFDLRAASSPNLVLSLTGPAGFTGFTDINADSGTITTPTAGTYTLTARGLSGATGAFTFALLDTLQVNVPVNTSYSTALAGTGQLQVLRVSVPTAHALVAQLTDTNSGDQNEFYAKFGAAPTRSSYDYRFSSVASPNQSLVVPLATPGIWYFMIYCASGNGTGTYTFSTRSADLLVHAVTPDHYAAGTSPTLTLTGAGFDASTSVSLVGNALSFNASSVRLDTFAQLTATFDLAAVPPGTYSVRVSRASGATDTLANAFTVAGTGSAHLQTNLTVPASLGRNQTATIYVQYSNTGAVAMPAPLLVLESSDATQKPLLTLNQSLLVQGIWTSAVPDGFATSISFLAGGQTPGVLQPGETITVPVYYAGLLAPWNMSNNIVPFDLRVITTSEPTAIDWASVKTATQPPGINAASWNGIFANIVAQTGTTWGDYVQMLDSNAQYLGQLGESITDVGQLWSFQVQQADAPSTVSTLSSAVDDSLPAPGMSLSFGRSFGESLDSRYTFGALGYGWSIPWQISATTLSDGTVAITGAGGAQSRYQPDSRHSGRYFAETGETSVLTKAADGTLSLAATDGTITHFRADGKLDYVLDTNGNKITAGYDSLGHLTSLTHSSGQSLTIGYNAAGLISAVTDSFGRQSTYTYDAANQHLLSVTTPDGTTSYTYATGAGANALASIAYPDGTHRYFTYDNQGRLWTTSVDGGAQPLTFTYNGGQITVTDGACNSSSAFLNELGMVGKTKDGLGNVSSYAYDPATFQVSQVTDAAGQNQRFSYDKNGNLLKIIDQLGNRTTFTYGPLGRLATMTDANGNVTRYSYDPHGNLLSTIYADGSREDVTSFDPLGEPLAFVNRNAQSIGYTYNSNGQLTTESLADGSQYTYTYDSHGNLKTAVDATGTTTFTYNAADELARVDYPGGMFLLFTLDAAGRRTSMVDQTGFTTNYSYDSLGQLWKLTDGSGNPVVTYTYDAVGRLSRKDNGNGTYTTYLYDANGNVLHLINYAPGGAVNSRFDYTYNSLGQETGETTIDGVWTYSYDATGQLTHAVFASNNTASIPNQDLLYNYDAMGNRTTTVINGVTTAYVTNNLNQYTSVGGVACQYDANGNLLYDGTNTYSYNALNQLVSVAAPGGNTTYTYNALGQLVSTTANGQAMQYLIDPAGLGNVVGTYAGDGSVVIDYRYGSGLTSQVATGGAYYYDFDSLGSTAGMSSGDGSYVNRYCYLPFGESLVSTVSATNTPGFVAEYGVQYDASGTVHMRARVYVPSLGRFASSDPLGLAGGDSNTYRYCGNNVTGAVDPMGLVYAKVGVGVARVAVGVNSDGTTYLGLGVGAGSRGSQSITVSSKGAVSVSVNVGGTGVTVSSGDLKEGPYANASIAGAGGAASVSVGPDGKVSFGSGRGGYGTEGGAGASIEGGCIIKLPFKLPFGAPGATGGNVGGAGQASIPAARDPNDKIGPSGFGSANFVAETGSGLAYRIDFENASTASAPAQAVTITDQLSSSFDWSTFRLSEVAFGDTLLSIPADSQYYSTAVPMTYNGQTFNVEIEAGIHADTGMVYAKFQSVDPTTELPPDVLTGFLPPEDGTGRGLGHISYTVAPRSNLSTGTQIRNIALITFDQNLSIATNLVDPNDPSKGTDPAKEALITIDAGAPTSHVGALPPTTHNLAIPVSWSGTDDAGGSGVATYDVYVSDNGGAWSLWQSKTTATSASYAGTNGHTYGFYCVATDNVGNQEAKASAPETSVTIDTTAPTVGSFQVNDGTIQRSMVNKLTVTFSEPVALTSNALQVVRRNGSAVPGLTVSVPANPSGDQKTWLVTFSGSAVVNGSLPDGGYKLVVSAAGVSDLAGNPLTGGYSQKFFRLFGDYDGNRIVNRSDVIALRQAIAQSGSAAPWFDYDGNGTIDKNDLLKLRARLRRSLL